MSTQRPAWSRVSLRDAALAAVILCLGLAWFVDHRQLSGELADARPWRHRAAVLEEVLKQEGWEVEHDLTYVHFSKPGQVSSLAFQGKEPSAVNTRGLSSASDPD